MSKVYVLIPSHNNKKEVLEILGCLDQQTYNNIKIILVDDGSADNTENEVSKSYPETVILKGDGNLWWTGANVMGIDYILQVAGEGDFILLLNNDLIVENDYIETLVNASMANERAIAGSTTVDYNNPDFIEGGVQLDHRLNLTVNRDRTSIEHTEFDMNVDVLPGRGTLVPVEVFKKIGSFNYKKLPHYGADYEFTLRAKRAGYKLVICHKAKVFAKLNITGIDIPDKKFISLKECYDLLFSNKSSTNFIYYMNYVQLCSEKNHRMKNMLCNARGILSATISKTVPCYPFKIIQVMIFNIYRFFFKDYPLRSRDLGRFGLNREKLLNDNILLERNLTGKNVFYYYINTEAVSSFEKLSLDERISLSRLRRHSFSIQHKFAIIFDQFNLMIRKNTVK